MRMQWELATFLICALYLITINIPSVGPFLFRRKNVHHVVNDPFQVKNQNITRDNLFAWLNMKNHIKFKLWTRANSKLAHELRIGDLESLHTSNFDSRRLTKIIVHGYAHSANEIYLEDWIVSLRDSYLHLADLNVIIIDYTLFAMPAFYWTAAPDLAAKQLTAMIKFLADAKQITLEGLHLLGFSWGAHISGIAGYQMGGRIGRITGLDPAQPTFRLVDETRRLDKSDAMFVDIIHTNSGRTFMEGHLGLGIPLGHADYYPNSGRAQPGCPVQWTYAYDEIECDHARSVNFFAESIVSPVAFPSCRCDNWDHYVKGECPCEPDDIVYMGEHSGHDVRGKFYLFTKEKEPFGLGSQLKVSLPNIDEYDPDFNNTGYHNHLRPFHLKNEPSHHPKDQVSHHDHYYDPMTTTTTILHKGSIITLNPQENYQLPMNQSYKIPNNNNSFSSPQNYLDYLNAPKQIPEVYWEPQATYSIKSEPVREYTNDDHQNNLLNSPNNFKRHVNKTSADAISKSPLLNEPHPQQQQQQQQSQPATIIVSKANNNVHQHLKSFSKQLFEKYVN